MKTKQRDTLKTSPLMRKLICPRENFIMLLYSSLDMCWARTTACMFESPQIHMMET